jgi:hypothetical protein
MDWKQIVGLIVLIFVVIPMLFSAVFFIINMNKQTTDEQIESGAELAIDIAFPWWLGIVEWLTKFGTIGAILIFALIWILRESGTL